MRYQFVRSTYLPGQANAAAKAAADAGRPDGLAAYWITEIGTLNQTIELWSDPRPAPGGAAPLEQETFTLTGVRGPAAPASPGGFYEMRHYWLRPGVAADWVEIFTAGLPARERISRIVGLFASDPGEPDQVVHIWGYPDLNTRVAARAAALQLPAWQEFLGKSRDGKMVVRQNVSILLAAGPSPLT